MNVFKVLHYKIVVVFVVVFILTDKNKTLLPSGCHNKEKECNSTDVKAFYMDLQSAMVAFWHHIIAGTGLGSNEKVTE